MNDQQRELAPCPFCGSKAEILTLEGETDDPSIGAQCVQCTSRSCGAASGLVFPLMDNVTDVLAERWNRRALTQPQAQQAVIDYVPGTWFKSQSVDQTQDFYLSRLPEIREAAREHGYAIGVHGSTRRDFDLIAMQWREGASDKDTLAHAIAMAACGIDRQGAYEWEEKGAGRVACSIPICWTPHPSEVGAGHIDLSLIKAQQAAVVPVFWYRKRSDGGYDGPISDAAIEDVRRKSGAWTPLYEVAPPPPVLPLSAWQPIETAPKDGSHILLFCQDSAVKIGGGYWFAKKNCWVHGGYMRRLSEPTHWQPLPATPITEPGAGGEGV